MVRQREKFFNLPSLLVIGVLISLALFILFPRQAVFEDIDYLENPDALSIAYLRVLVRADPDNPALRINLARMLRETGQPSAAMAVLEALLAQDSVPSLAMEEYLKLLKQQLYATTSDVARDDARRALFAQAISVPEQGYSFDRNMALLSPLLDALRPTQSGLLLQMLQEQADSPRQKLALARRLAKLHEAQNQPGAAAEVLKAQLTEATDQELDPLVDDILRLQLASGNPRGALETFRAFIADDDMAQRDLEQGIRVARMAGAPDDARRWLGRLAGTQPNNLDLQRELLIAQLADNRVDQALTTIRRLQRHPKELSQDDRQRVAQVLEWNNRPKEALPIWLQLYRETGSSLAYERGRALSDSLADRNAIASLLKLAEARGQLDPKGYRALAETRIRDGRIDQALAALERGLQQYPGSAMLQAGQLDLLINTRDYQGAIDALLARSAMSDEQRLQLANLYWRTRRPEDAFESLDFEAEDPTLNAEVRASRLRLGTYLGRTHQIRDDYRRLLDDIDTVSPVLQDQLLNLAVVFGDYAAASRLSQMRYSATGDTRYLASNAEYQAVLANWGGVTDTLDRWLTVSPAAEQLPRYWTLRALAYQQQGQLAAADQAYRRAYQLQPDDREVLTGWAWLQLNDVQRFQDTLPHLLARLAREPTPETNAVLAYGYSALGDTWQARQWFLRGLSRHSREPEWLWSTANVLEQTGNHRSADALLARLEPQDFANAESRLAFYRSRGLDRQARRLLARSLELDVENVAERRRDLGNQAQNDDNALLAESWYARAGLPHASLLYPAPENREQQAARLSRQLESLESPETPATARERLRDTINLQQQFPRSLQLGSEWQDLGSFRVHQTRLSGRYAMNDVIVEAEARSLNASGSGRLRREPDRSNEGSIALTLPGKRFDTTLGVEQLARAEGHETAWQLETRWAPADRWAVSLGLGRNERAPDSAESWWLVDRDREYVGANYAPWSRLSLYGQLAALHHHSEDGEKLGNGYSASLTGSYTLWREDPVFTLSAGYQRQSLNLTDPLPPSIQTQLDTPLEAGSLLTEDYERLGIAARWSHGEPHATYRTAPSPRAFVEIGSGYVLSTKTPEIGIGAGVGWQLFGDDELALSGRWTSEGLDGSGRADLNLTYTIFPGR
ncbi:tetratricopeptide repeat protein [Marinobacter fonticola]|uniref:tetratricopeptide repeat protein n=1 Tax=Marinobacter fonticola TaxID=2603215 RepID=UPI00143D0206|nr:tetratricopeptide repeat protein [Marinobacter fonticola]